MTQIETADIILRADEICYGMEIWEDTDGFRTRLIVERGDMPVGIVIHHGPDENFSGKIPPMFVSGQFKVGEALEESERHRHDLWGWNHAQRVLEGSTLFQDAIAAEEQAIKALHGRSTFGPHQTVQRNPDYSHQTTVRNWWAERAEKTGKSASYRKAEMR